MATDNELLQEISDHTSNTYLQSIDISANTVVIQADIAAVKANTAVIQADIDLIKSDIENIRKEMQDQGTTPGDASYNSGTYTLRGFLQDVAATLLESSVDGKADSTKMSGYPNTVADSRTPSTVKDHIMLILQELRSLDDGGTGADHNRDGSDGVSPVAFLLATEMSSGQDLDGNGLVFGEGFIMDLTLTQYPEGMQGIVRKFYDTAMPDYVAWTGTKHTWDSYLATIPTGMIKTAATAAIIDLKKIT